MVKNKRLPIIFGFYLILTSGCTAFDSALIGADGNQSLSSGSDNIPLTVRAAGWNTPISLNDPIYSEPLGIGTDSISGVTIQNLVTNPSVIVRPDGNSCLSCHGGPGTLRPEWTTQNLTRTDYCNLVESFVAADKPAVLKIVFGFWKANGCPN